MAKHRSLNEMRAEEFFRTGELQHALSLSEELKFNLAVDRLNQRSRMYSLPELVPEPRVNRVCHVVTKNNKCETFSLLAGVIGYDMTVPTAPSRSFAQ